MSQVYPHNASNMPPRPCSAHPEVLTVWKKTLFFRGNGFTALDSTGNTVFRVENYTPNAKEEVVLMDGAGNCLITLRRKILSLHQRWEGFTCNGVDGSSEEAVFCIKRSWMLSRKTCVDVFMKPHMISSYFGWRHCDYHIEGSFRERSCTIYDRSTRAIVAEVKRKRAANSETLMLGKDVFSLVVHPGGNRALIMSWIVVLDHINREDLDILKRNVLLSVDSWKFVYNKFSHRKEEVEEKSTDKSIIGLTHS
eukprot:Gb_03480 [translate_table: standard]